jgi:hypothetical protein
MPCVSRYHSGSVKVRAAEPFNLSNFHTAFRNKNRNKNPVASVPSSSVPHITQVLRSFQPFLINRRRVPTLPTSTMVKACEAFPPMLFSAKIPDGTSKLGLCLRNTVAQAPDLIIRLVFHEKRNNLSAGQSRATSISNYSDRLRRKLSPRLLVWEPSDEASVF